MPRSYRELLDRIKEHLRARDIKKEIRLNVPEPDIVWTGNRTIVRNFGAIASSLNRDPQKLLMFFAREMAAAASLDEDKRAIFMGKKEKQAFVSLVERYIKHYVICPVCGSPDTKLEKQRRITFLVCEACGARSSIRE